MTTRNFITAVLLAGGIVAVVCLYSAAYIVHQNEQALVLRWGEPQRTARAGLNWKIPFAESVIYFDKRILDLDIAEQEVMAADQKRLVVDGFGRYRIVDPLLFYQRVTDVENVPVRLGPIMESTLKYVLAHASFQDLVRDRRGELMGKIASEVNAQAKGLGIEIVDVRIRRANLPPQNAKSVFDRMSAERARESNEFRAEGTAASNRIRAEADRNVTVIKAEAQKKAEQLRGEGDAERNRIYAEAYQRDPDFFAFYRSMQAYEQGLKPDDTRIVVSPDSEFFRYFNNPSGAPQSAPASAPQPTSPAGAPQPAPPAASAAP